MEKLNGSGVLTDREAAGLAEAMSGTQVASAFRDQVSLFKSRDTKESLFSQVMKAAANQESNQGVQLGVLTHQFDFRVAKSFLTTNVHHARSIRAKVATSVGLGLVSSTDAQKLQEAKDRSSVANFDLSKATKILNKLTDNSFQDTMDAAAEDYYQVGNGYLEVVRRNPTQPNSPIVGLHHLAAEEVQIFVEDRLLNRHYQIIGETGAIIGSTAGNFARFARFGDAARFAAAATAPEATSTLGGDFAIPADRVDSISEVIHFRKPTSLHRFYGFPDWIPATTAIELVQCWLQHKYDFFLNRGVPEFLLFIIGQKLPKDDWDKIERAMKANIGLGNSHKSTAINLSNSEIEVILHKLNLDAGSQDSETDLKTDQSLDIVSAHGVPPLLAGIQVPGKMGANNELPNALVLFQITNIGPDQEIFENTLACTLGDPALNGGLGITEADLKFRKMMDQIDFNRMNVQSRMRQTMPEAQAEGRNPDDGLRR